MAEELAEELAEERKMALGNSWRAFDSRLIEVVRLKPVLYNTRLKDFRNKSMKANANGKRRRMK